MDNRNEFSVQANPWNHHFNLLAGPELLLANREVELSLCAGADGPDA